MKITMVPLVSFPILFHLRHHQLLATKENICKVVKGITGKAFEFDLNSPPTPETTNHHLIYPDHTYIPIVQKSPRDSKDLNSDGLSQSDSLVQRARGSFNSPESELRQVDNDESRECSNLSEESTDLQGVMQRQESSGTQAKTNCKSKVDQYTSGPGLLFFLSNSLNYEVDLDLYVSSIRFTRIETTVIFRK